VRKGRCPGRTVWNEGWSVLVLSTEKSISWLWACGRRGVGLHSTRLCCSPPVASLSTSSWFLVCTRYYSPSLHLFPLFLLHTHFLLIYPSSSLLFTTTSDRHALKLTLALAPPSSLPCYINTPHPHALPPRSLPHSLPSSQIASFSPPVATRET
jgi:hypothetical protein